MDYKKHDLAKLKQIYAGEWDSFENVEDKLFQKRLVQIKKYIAEFARTLKTDWFFAEGRTFVIRILPGTMLEGYSKALLDAILSEADWISFYNDGGELAMIVTVDSVLQIFDGKRI